MRKTLGVLFIIPPLVPLSKARCMSPNFAKEIAALHPVTSRACTHGKHNPRLLHNLIDRMQSRRISQATHSHASILSVPWRGGLIFFVGDGNGMRSPSANRI